ncbi:MAG: hypothetical protein Kow0037_02370 [Calditrichia bacterium]
MVSGQVQKSQDIELDGLILDQTLTKAGRDFYDVFYSNWEPPPGISGYDIKIGEKPMPRIGTQISVTVNLMFEDYLVYLSFIKPRYEEVEDAAKDAIQNVHYYLYQKQQLKQDLGGEDMSGTGIY